MYNSHHNRYTRNRLRRNHNLNEDQRAVRRKTLASADTVAAASVCRSARRSIGSSVVAWLSVAEETTAAPATCQCATSFARRPQQRTRHDRFFRRRRNATFASCPSSTASTVKCRIAWTRRRPRTITRNQTARTTWNKFTCAPRSETGTARRMYERTTSPMLFVVVAAAIVCQVETTRANDSTGVRAACVAPWDRPALQPNDCIRGSISRKKEKGIIKN